MAEEQPSLHIDNDWKKQAQEEKRKLAEQAAKNKPPAATTAPPSLSAAPSGKPAPAPGSRGRAQRELPPPGMASLVQSLMTQVLYYLGDLPSAQGQGAIDVDMAKYQLDTLSTLEEKTKNNLTDEEKHILDAALYETRSRFINVASQLLGP